MNTLLPLNTTTTPSVLHWCITEVPKRKTASGRIRAGVGYINIPKHWPMAYKQTVIQTLQQRLEHSLQKQTAQLNKQQALLETTAPNNTLNIQTLDALVTYVFTLNNETFQQPLRAVKIGRAKYSHLAQINIRTGVMTVSKYSLGANIPANAFRYLILHELAHFLEANHSPRFWQHVARFCPDYKQQRQLMQAYHQQQVTFAENRVKP